MSERCQGLLEVCHRLAERRAVGSPGAGLLAVGHGLVPHRAPEGMRGQALDLLGQAVRVELFERFDNAGVQQTAALLEETAVGHLVRQGMLEGVFRLGKEPRLVQELGRLEVRQPAIQRRLRAAQQWPGAGPRVPRYR